MLNRTIFVLILIIFIFSCGEKKDSAKTVELDEKVEEITQTKLEESDVEVENKKIEKTIENKSVSKCKCFDGIGSTKKDKPSLTFDFLNGNSISVCGYYDKEMQDEVNLVMSEFNIFDCSTGKSYVEYDATQTCRIKKSENSLIIEELNYLPSGENWDWELIKIAEQTISSNENGRIIVSEIKPKIKTITIDRRAQTEFLNSIKKGKGINSEWELEIGKLAVLALSGNEEAWSILKDYENYTGEKTDGALAETWKDTVALVSWIMNK